MNEKVEVLVSAMHQKDDSIFERTNIRSDALLINQCDKEGYYEKITDFGKNRIISTTERGLSKSRNMALKNSCGDICLLCDDDEHFEDNYQNLIIGAYEQYSDADIICFQVKLGRKKYKNKPYKIGYLQAIRVSSVQISLKLDSIKKAGILFDEEYGSGTPRGSGEENIFIYDCLKKGLKVYYVPVIIGEVNTSESNWFKGYTNEYFINRGAIIYRLMGKVGIIYCTYFAVTKYRLYKNNMSMMKAFLLMLNGMKNH